MNNIKTTCHTFVCQFNNTLNPRDKHKQFLQDLSAQHLQQEFVDNIIINLGSTLLFFFLTSKMHIIVQLHLKIKQQYHAHLTYRLFHFEMFSSTWGYKHMFDQKRGIVNEKKKRIVSAFLTIRNFDLTHFEVYLSV
jgi:hypothetical protein